MAMFTKSLLTDELTGKLRDFVASHKSTEMLRMPPERVLAENFGVSRPSIRTALKNLVLEGLVVQKQGSGTYIVPESVIGCIHVMVDDGIKPTDPFFSEFLSELVYFSAEHQVRLQMVKPSTPMQGRVTEAPLVIIGVVDDEVLRAAKKTYSQIVAAGFYPDFVDIAQVTVDHYRIGWEAAEILSEANHTHVALLRGPEAYPAASGRCRGFEASARRRGQTVTELRGKMNWRSGYAVADDLVRMLGTGESPTAVFASNDSAALGMMQRLAEVGVKVPDDVSLIGCDDIHMASEVSPALSTFRWDTKYLIGEVINILSAERIGEAASHARLLLPARYIPRETVRVIRKR